MEILLKRQNEAVHLVAENELGNEVSIDGSPAIGGKNKGARPMELLLMGLGGCSSMDIISILKKMKVEVGEYDVKITAERDKDNTPSLLTAIHVEFIVETHEENKDKVIKAINLSMDKYCSVTKILEKTATNTHELTLKPAT